MPGALEGLLEIMNNWMKLDTLMLNLKNLCVVVIALIFFKFGLFLYFFVCFNYQSVCSLLSVLSFKKIVEK